MGKRIRWGRRLTSLLLTIAMLFNLLPTVWAAADTVTVTLPNDTTHYSYEVDSSQYQGVESDVYTITKGSNFTFAVKLEEAYTQSGIKVSVKEGNEVSPITSQTYTLTSVQENTEITVDPVNTSGGLSTWELNQYTVSIPSSGTGFTLSQVTVGAATMTPSGSGTYQVTAKHGDQLVFTVQLLDGYTGANPQASYGGTSISGNKNTNTNTITYTIDAVNATLDIDIGAVGADKHAVTLPTSPAGFTIAGVGGATDVEHGGTYQFAVNVASGYSGTPTVTAVATDNPSTKFTVTKDSGTNVYSVKNVTVPITILVSGLSPAKCTVSWTNHAAGAYRFEVVNAQPAAVSMLVAYNDTITFSLILDESISGSNMAVYANGKAIAGTQDPGNPLKYNYTYQVTTDVRLTVQDVASKTYKVGWNVDGAATEETYKHGEAPVFKGSTSKPAVASTTYTFTGWAWSTDSTPPSTDRTQYSETLSAQDQFIDVVQGETLPTVTEARTYYAVYRAESVRHTITWVVRGQSGIVTTTTKVEHGSKPLYNTGTDPEGYSDASSTYTFSGWKKDGTGSETSSANLPNATENVTYVAQYTMVAKSYLLTVNYKKSDSNLQVVLPQNTSASTAVGTAYNIAPTAVTGYYFAADHPLTGKMPADNLNITVTYYPDAATIYTVKHFKMGTDGSYPSDATDTVLLTGVTDSKIAPATKQYVGFGVGMVQNAPVGGFAVAADGSTVINIHYPRNQYNVTWDANGGYFDRNQSIKTKSTKVYYGAEINLPTYDQLDRADDASGTFSYVFAGTWQGYTDSPKPTMPAQDVTYHADWTQNTKKYDLTVKYAWVDGHVVDSGCVLPTNPATVQYGVGADYTITPDVLTGHIASGTLKGKMPAHNLEVTVYYAVDSAIQYNVEHYFQPVGASTDTALYVKLEDATETNYGVGEQTTQAVALNYEGFTAQTIAQQKISAAGDTVVKVYYNRNFYDVTWDAGEGVFRDSQHAQTTSVQYGAEIIAPAVSPTRDPDNYSAYTFKNWSGHTIGMLMPAHPVTHPALWDSTAFTYELKVEFDRTDKDNVAATAVTLPSTVTQQVPVNSAYSIDLSAQAYLVPGYTANLQVVEGNMPVGGVTVTVMYSPNANTEYTVRHVRQALDDSYSDATTAVNGVVEVETLTGTTNTSTAARPRVYEGFTAVSPTQATIAADGTVVVTIRYTRNSYNVVWDAAGGTFGSQSQLTVSTKYGAQITQPQEIPTHSSDVSTNYIFKEWLDMENIAFSAIAMPANTVYYRASWSTTGYPYILKVQYAITDGHTDLLPAQPHTQELPTGAAYSLSKTANPGVFPDIQGYTADTDTVSGTMPASDVTYTITYRPNANTAYSVVHHWQTVDGGTDAETDYESTGGTDTQNLTGTTNKETNLTPRTKTGFHVSLVNTWSNANIAGDGTTVVHIYYDRNEHVVTWSADNGYFTAAAEEVPAVTQKKATYLYGQTIKKPDETPLRDSDTHNSYIFDKWTDLTDTTTMPDADVTYHAAWSVSARQYAFKVIYELQNAGSAITPQTHTAEMSAAAAYDITAPEVPGFTPVSVLPANANFSSNSPKIAGNMPADDLTYTVTYAPNTDTPYQVQVYLQDADGTYGADASYTYDAANKFGEDDAVTYQDTTGTQTVLTGAEYSYINYHLDTAAGKGVQNVEILGIDAEGDNQNGTTVTPVIVKIYYARDMFGLSWDFASGDVVAGSPYSLTGSYRWGETITAPTTGGDTPELTRIGHNFNKWIVTLDPVDTKVVSIPETMPPANLSILAQWKASAYAVTFVPGDSAVLNANGSALTDGKIKVTYGAKYGKLPTASLVGKVFQGWFTAQEGGSKITADTLVALTADTNLYAQFADTAPDGGNGTEPTPDPGQGGGSGGGGGGGGGGGSSGGSTKPTSKPSTIVKPDDSETTPAEDKTTDKTTTYPNGTVVEKKTDKDGNVVTTETRKDGTLIVTKNPSVGETTAHVTLANSMKQAVVFIPYKNTTAGTIAVIVHPDGTEETIKYSVPTKDGMTIRLTAPADVKIIDGSISYDDVQSDFWASDAITFVTARGIFSGTSDRKFSPDTPMSRAMLMTVLARLENQDTAGGAQWYSQAMDWAKEVGITDGSNPDGSISREQLATMLYRFAGSPEVADGALDFADTDEVSNYAEIALVWATRQGIINGTGDGKLSPKGNATRAQVAAMLMRYIENLLK